MRNIERRLERLERLPQMQPPPSPLEQIRAQALHKISDQDLDLLRTLARSECRRGTAGSSTDRETEILQAHHVALEAEAQRMGFKSYAQAERRWGRK